MRWKIPAPLSSLLLQIVPLLVFLVVDAAVDRPLLAIVAALAFVVGQTLLNLLRRRPLDRFLLLDLALVGAMGGASLITQSEIFFKLKPAVLEGVMIPFLLFLALAPEQLLLDYFRRYALGAPPQEAILPLLRRLLGLLAVLSTLHTGAVVLSALYASKRTWGLISGPGFYLVLLPLLLYALVLRLRRRRGTSGEASATESLPLRSRERIRDRRPR